MNKKLAELKVNKSTDYYDKVAKALENAGFILILETDTLGERYYIIAESEEKQKVKYNCKNCQFRNHCISKKIVEQCSIPYCQMFELEDEE